MIVNLRKLALAPCAAALAFTGLPAAAAPVVPPAGFHHADATTQATPPVAAWWHALGDARLDTLIAQALRDSPDMAVARARIAQARAKLATSHSASRPTINAYAVGSEIDIPNNLLNSSSTGRTDSTQANLAFDASWEIDLYGANRRRVEAARARGEEADAEYADAAVALSAEVARTYLDLRARQVQLALLDRQARIDAALCDLADQRLKGGTASAQPLDQLRTQASQTETTRASARAELAVLADQLAVLTGQQPGALDSLATATADVAGSSVPLPPAEVPVGDPARLIAHRPDVRSAEREWAAARADVRVQQIAGLPQISFLGLLGTGGKRIGDLFAPSTLIGLAVPQISWAPFDGGRNRAAVASKRASVDEAEARYQGKVLAALEDAEAALARFASQRTAYAKALESQQDTDRTALLQTARFTAGTIARSDALLAERNQVQAALNRSDATLSLTAAFVTVEKALGLGWQDPPQT